MDDESVFWYLQELEDDMLNTVLDEWYKYKSIPNARQPWKVIPAAMLTKEWKYNAKTGLVHDSVIEKLQSIVINCYLKLYVNTVLFGHTPMNPFHYAEGYLPEDWKEEDFDEWLTDFEDFAIDDRYNWRISDYGLEKIGNYSRALITEEDQNKKLLWIDCILNVVHQRSDLAKWFVEGGSQTLSTLAISNPAFIED